MTYLFPVDETRAFEAKECRESKEDDRRSYLSLSQQKSWIELIRIQEDHGAVRVAGAAEENLPSWLYYSEGLY